VLTDKGQTEKCYVMRDSRERVPCDVLTDSGQTVHCEVLTVERPQDEVLTVHRL